MDQLRLRVFETPIPRALQKSVDILIAGEDAKHNNVFVGLALENEIAAHREAALSGAPQILIAAAADIGMGRQEKEARGD